jgi:hypothetical protein
MRAQWLPCLLDRTAKVRRRIRSELIGNKVSQTTRPRTSGLEGAPDRRKEQQTPEGPLGFLLSGQNAPQTRRTALPNPAQKFFDQRFSARKRMPRQAGSAPAGRSAASLGPLSTGRDSPPALPIHLPQGDPTNPCPRPPPTPARPPLAGRYPPRPPPPPRKPPPTPPTASAPRWLPSGSPSPGSVPARRFFQSSATRRPGLFHADRELLSATKLILDTKNPTYRAVAAVRSEASGYWRTVTLPFPEAGIRLLPQNSLGVFASTFVSYRERLQLAARELAARLPALPTSCYPVRKEDLNRIRGKRC